MILYHVILYDTVPIMQYHKNRNHISCLYINIHLYQPSHRKEGHRFFFIMKSGALSEADIVLYFFCTCKLLSPVLNSPRQSCKIKKDSLKHWNLHSLKFHPLTTRTKGSKINRGKIFLCLQYICCFF